MTPMNQAVTELLLAVESAEARAEAYLDENDHATDHNGRLTDHRTEVAGDLCDALDRIVPGMGQRLMQAMYPELDLCLEDLMTLMTAMGYPLPEGLESHL